MAPRDTGVLKEILTKLMVIILGYCHYDQENKSLSHLRDSYCGRLRPSQKFGLTLKRTLIAHKNPFTLSLIFFNNLFLNAVLTFLNSCTFHYTVSERTGA